MAMHRKPAAAMLTPPELLVFRLEDWAAQMMGRKIGGVTGGGRMRALSLQTLLQLLNE
jgi:hypothetical protein